MKSPLASKTIWLGIGMSAIGLVTELTKILPADIAPKVLSFAGFASIVLRFFTSDPVGFGGEK